MKNERILVADDAIYAREAIIAVFETYGQADGHKIVGQASSVREMKGLLEKGLRPTVALVDGNFPLPGDGERAAQLIKMLSPETLIISFSSQTQSWGDQNWNKGAVLSGKELVKALTDLQH